MSTLPETPHTESTPSLGTGAVWNLPVGVVSPLWPMFATAAGFGVASWWMSRWFRPVNLEALLPTPSVDRVETVLEAAFVAPVEEAAVALLEPVTPELEPEPEPILEPPPAPALLEAVAPDPIVEPSPVIEETVELAPDPVLESSVEAAPVVEETSPEAAPVIAPKARKAAAKSAPNLD